MIECLLKHFNNLGSNGFFKASIILIDNIYGKNPKKREGY